MLGLCHVFRVNQIGPLGKPWIDYQTHKREITQGFYMVRQSTYIHRRRGTCFLFQFALKSRIYSLHHILVIIPRFLTS